jgi:hypothetical protein
LPWSSTVSSVPSVSVQAVDVLRDDRVEVARGREVRERAVGRVGFEDGVQ